MTKLSVAAVAGLLCAQAALAADSNDWVTESNGYAQVLLEVIAKYAPEQAGQLGVDGLDDKIVDLKPEVVQRFDTDTRAAVTEFEGALATTENPKVRQDLEILIASGTDAIRDNDLDEQYFLPYSDVPEIVFGGIRSLLDPQIPEERQAAAVTRLRRYAGMEDGYTPITELAIDRSTEKFGNEGLLGPYRDEVEQNLANSARFITGIRELFEEYGLSGWKRPMNRLERQIDKYNDWIRAELLPRTRTTHQLPEEVYAFNLKQRGVDIPVDQLVSMAQKSFIEIRNEMLAIAPLVAQQHGWDLSDYRDVIRELKKNQLVGETILPHYQKRIVELEEIIRANDVVSLPERDMQIRLASEAESAQIPAPHMRPPRLIGNTGEYGTFVLPLKIPAPPGSEQANLSFDDFTFDAASWTLTVHEGRPGHEMQFSSIVESGVSTARMIFAFNSVNVEGWALYAEAELKPYLPIDGQLISLQHRLLRAARAMLDPLVNQGKITPEEVNAFLRNEVVLSPAMANQETERYTFRAPGQATSYFYGYTRLMEIRAKAELALGERFDRKSFHDFVLAQGLLPPGLLEQAVMEEFVPSQR